LREYRDIIKVVSLKFWDYSKIRLMIRECSSSSEFFQILKS